MDKPGLLCCDFGPDTFKPYVVLPPHTYTDHLGFRYRLCDRHYRAFVLAMEHLRAAGREGGSQPAMRGRILRRILAQESEESAGAPPG
jgi:hypothetical protein